MLYICILHIKPFISNILYVAASNTTGYVGRPDGLTVGEQKEARPTERAGGGKGSIHSC